MESEFSESSENETIYNQSLNFVSWLEKEQNTCLVITKKNLKQFKENKANFIEQIKTNGLEMKSTVENAIVNLNLINRLSHEQKLNKIVDMEETKEIVDIIDYEQKVTNLNNEIKLLKKEHKNKIDESKLKIVAHKKAIEYYETNFNLKSKLLISNEDQTVIETIFENKTHYPVKMVLDKSNNILSFEVSSLEPTKERDEITNWFAKTKDPVSLMIMLRKYILNLN